MYYTTSTTTQLQIAAIMCCEAGSITLKVENMHLQNGGSDCGVFAIAYATDLCYGNCPSTLQYCQDRLRAHFIRCLKSKHMIPFPSRCCRPGKPHAETISVYCSCHLPESDDEKMAACDKCGEWYHLSCAKIPPEVFKNSQLPWMCSKCQMWKYPWRSLQKLTDHENCVYSARACARVARMRVRYVILIASVNVIT